VVVVVSLLVSAAAARQWTSRDGKFSVEAELLDVKDGKVVLKQKDGSLLTSPLDKLSLADVQYVNEVLKSTEAGGAGKGETPSKAKSDTAAPAAAVTGDPPDSEVSAILADLASGERKRVGDRLKLLAATGPAQPSREVAKALESLLTTNTNSFNRVDAAKALANWSTEENIPVMVRIIKADKSIWVLQPLIEAITKYKSDTAIEAIAQQLSNVFIRSEASQALKAYGPIAEDAVIAQLQTGDHFTRIEACEVLRMIGTRKSIPPLELAARDPDVFVKGAAKAALQTIRQTKRVAPKPVKPAGGSESPEKNVP
jgi:hypothetical protein